MRKRKKVRKRWHRGVLKSFDNPRDMASLVALIRLIGFIFEPHVRGDVTAQQKHNMECTIKSGKVIFDNFWKFIEIHLVDEIPLACTYVDREVLVLAFMMAGLPYEFKPQSWCYFHFKARDRFKRSRPSMNKLNMYIDCLAQHPSALWTPRRHAVFTRYSHYCILIILLSAQRLKRHLCLKRTLPSELWMLHILPYFRKSDFIPVHRKRGRIYYFIKNMN